MFHFKKKQKRVIEVGGQKIELEPKKGFFGFGKKKGAQEETVQTPAPAAGTQQNISVTQPLQIERPRLAIPEKPAARGKEEKEKKVKEAKQKQPQKPIRPAGMEAYFKKTAQRQKGLEEALREEGVETTPYAFVKRMFIAAILFSIAIAIAIFVILIGAGLATLEGALFGFLLGIAVFQGSYRSFLQFPITRARKASRNAEKDILFAAREMIISLRSGMPLYDAIKSVGVGYGDASIEFTRIVDKVRFGAPLEDAIDDAIANSKSPSFRRIMLQASVSIRAGADVISSLQSVLDQLSQERVIELRAYGQKLNAIAMFYMLFGVILPSMGIAVITILTTFISLFSVTITVLGMILTVMFLLQIIFLRLIVRSRPIFSM